MSTYFTNIYAILICCKLACVDYIQALDKCHKNEFYKRVFGLCNNEKEALTKCLKEARRVGTMNAIDVNKIKREHIEGKWKKMSEEEYGEDAILKKIMQKHNISKADIEKN